jgi:hypothetical protein
MDSEVVVFSDQTMGNFRARLDFGGITSLTLAIRPVPSSTTDGDESQR